MVHQPRQVAAITGSRRANFIPSCASRWITSYNSGRRRPCALVLAAVADRIAAGAQLGHLVGERRVDRRVAGAVEHETELDGALRQERGAGFKSWGVSSNCLQVAARQTRTSGFAQRKARTKRAFQTGWGRFLIVQGKITCLERRGGARVGGGITESLCSRRPPDPPVSRRRRVEAGADELLLALDADVLAHCKRADGAGGGAGMGTVTEPGRDVKDTH